MTIDRLPILDLGPSIEADRDALRDAFERVLDSGQFIGGAEVTSFEEEAAAFLGVPYAVGLNSGTDALVIGLRALGVGPGDEVITTPFTFFATAEAISLLGATPVLVDIEQDTFNLDPERVEAAVTDQTKALLPVHLFGRPAAMDPLLDIARRHGLAVVEDCAQSFGARYDGEDGAGAGPMTGAMGDVGTYSFFPSKNLGAFGDAGMLATHSEDLAAVARKLRAHGGAHKYHNEMLGYNSRLDSLQAAMLRVRLQHVPEWNEARRAVAARYTDALDGVPGVVAPEVSPGHVFHQYTVRVTEGRRDAVAATLEAEGIQTMVYYPTPIHRLPVYLDGAMGTFPVTEKAADEVLSLPIGPSLETADVDRVVHALRQAVLS